MGEEGRSLGGGAQNQDGVRPRCLLEECYVKEGMEEGKRGMGRREEVQEGVLHRKGWV
jgi:hypothetical protein